METPMIALKSSPIKFPCEGPAARKGLMEMNPNSLTSRATDRELGFCDSLVPSRIDSGITPEPQASAFLKKVFMISCNLVFILTKELQADAWSRVTPKSEEDGADMRFAEKREPPSPAPLVCL